MAAPLDSSSDSATGRVVDLGELEERRARRAEQPEDSLQKRAERMVAALERRREEAEGRLAAAEDERSTLAVELERARRELIAARQRELAGAQALTDERRAAADEIEGLQRELDRRASEHEAIGTQVAGLRDALHALRLRVDESAVQALTAEAAEERLRRTALEALVVAERAARVAEAGKQAADGERLTARLAEAESALADAQALASQDRERVRALASARDELRATDVRAEAAETALHAETARAEAAETALRAVDARVASAEVELRGDLAEREAAVAALGAALVATAGELRAASRRQRATLAAGHGAQLAEERAGVAEERAAVAAELAATQERVAGLREQLVATTEHLRQQLAEERAARRVAEAALTRSSSACAVAEQQAAAALIALEAERRRPGALGGGNPIYDVLSSGSLVPADDHPALLRPASVPRPEGSDAPAVVSDLARAAARLRAGGDAERLEPLARVDPSGAHPVESAARTPELAVIEGVAAPAGAAASRLEPALLVAPETQSWLGSALVALAAVDPAAAERLMLAFLPVQAGAVTKDVAYELELPQTGRHVVRVSAQGNVVVASLTTAGPGDATAGGVAAGHLDFRITGAVEVLVALGAGKAPRRLRGATVRGRRRRLRRLLRALRAPVGLAELQAAHVRPRSGDLLALLCLAVPAEIVRGADFAVAYVVHDGDRRVRTLVRASRDGSLTVAPEAPDSVSADATVTVGAGELLGVLGGTAPVNVEGDAGAVATLHGWLREIALPPA